MKSRFIQILIFLSLTTFFSCGKSRFKPDSNLENLALQIERIDWKIIALDSSQLLSELVSLSEEHPEFYRDYLSIWDLNPEDTTQVCELFRDFLADSLQAQVHADVLKTFDNVSGLERKLSKAFSYLHYYFPQIKLPRVYFFVGGFNRSIMTGSDFVAIGADLYLGRDYAPYKNLTYDYLVYNMDPESIPVDVLSVILAPAFPFHSGKNRLIDNMLYQGKILYLLAVLLPDERSENIMGYSPEQWKWCERYEKQVWSSVIDRKHLFSTDIQLIRKYMHDAPFTAPVSQDAPGRLGAWIGWRIVDSYMNRQTECSLPQLLEENDYQKMLEASGYRP